MSELWIVYTHGRFGPEKLLGYVQTDSPGTVIRASSYCGFDRADKPLDSQQEQVFFTNPLGIANINDYRKWQRKRKSQ